MPGQVLDDETRKFIADTKCFCTSECLLTVNILFNPRMMPKILKEWGSLTTRKAMRALGLTQKQESAIVKRVESQGCMNGAIQAHNQKVLNGTNGHASGHANGALNGVANGSTHTNTETHPLN